MSIIISGDKLNEPKCSCDATVCELFNLIMQNYNLIGIIVDMISSKRKKMELDENKRYLDVTIEKLVSIFKITHEEASEFKKLWNNFYEKCKTGKVETGILLEMVIDKIGPFYYKSYKYINKCIDAMVYYDDGEYLMKLDGKNFDIVFFDDYCLKDNDNLVEIKEAEMHECKHDVSSFLPEENIPPKTLKKLDFIRKVYNTIDDDTIKFFIPTFMKGTYQEQNILNNKELQFIKIINGNEIISHIRRMKIHKK
ncbi:hypothetical protein ACJDU8_01005 [Clostridium sp. WILCCON 0269]|uniref:Uncharacterized protein n=1 Tax=Candidatus Clostridium eludens TaxID=3381663 RepID=A0ABW8SE62_9CLOT